MWKESQLKVYFELNDDVGRWKFDAIVRFSISINRYSPSVNPNHKMVICDKTKQSLSDLRKYSKDFISASLLMITNKKRNKKKKQWNHTY